MPAGKIHLKLPGPPLVVISEPAVHLPKAPTLGASWERTAKDIAQAFRGGSGLARSLENGFGLRNAIGSSALTAARGIAGVLLAEATAKFAAAFIRKALEQTDIPEVARFDRAMGRLGGALAGIAEGLVPAVAELGPILRAVERTPGAAVALATTVTTAVRYSVDALVVQITAALLPAANNAILARMPTTAGLERGGVRVVTPPTPGGSQIPGLPDVAISIPNGGLSFTEPQNVIAEDPLTQPRTGAILGAAGVLAQLAAPAVAHDLIREALERATTAIVDLHARAIMRSAESLKDFQAAGGPSLGMSGLLDEMRAARAEAIAAATASETIVSAPLWGSITDASQAAVHSLESGIAGALAVASKAARKFTVGMDGIVHEHLTPTSLAIDGLSDAIALDMQMIDKVAAGSERAARVAQIAQMSLIVLAATVQGSIAVAKGVAEAAAGDPVDAALHFTAAGLYAATAALAIGYGGVGGRASRPDTVSDRPLGSIADLVVILPGYSDPDRIRDEIARAIQSGGVQGGGLGGYAGSATKHLSAQELVSLNNWVRRAENTAAGFAGIGASSLVGGQLGVALSALGPIGWVAGVALGVVFGDRADREFRRLGRRIRHIF